MKIFVRLVILFTVVCTASAQFVPNRIWVGPTLGFSAFGPSFLIGAQGEYGITDNIAVGLELGYASYSIDSAEKKFGPIVIQPAYSYKYTLISALATGSYHFMPGEVFDPYIKAGIGYNNWDVGFQMGGKEVEIPTGSGTSLAQASGFGYSIQAGARYHFSDGLSARASVGYPTFASFGFDLATGGVSSSKKSSGDASDATADEEKKKKGRENEYSLWVGPYLMGKASIKTEVAEGWKTGIVFNVPPDFGASILVPFGKHSTVGFGLDFGLANYGYQFRPENDPRDSVTVVARYSYVNVFPHLNLGGFIIGVNFGMVNGARTRTVLDSAASIVGEFSIDESANPDTVVFENGSPDFGPGPLQYMASMVEVRIGGAIPVVTTDFGRLDVLMQAGYSLSGLFEDYRNYEGSYPIKALDPQNPRQRTTQPQESLNPHIVSLSLGLCYRFRLGF